MSSRTPRPTRRPANGAHAHLAPQPLGVATPSFLDDLDDLDSVIGEPDRATRKHWANEHATAIRALLDTPCLAEVPERIFRAHWFDADGDYVVATCWQNINVISPDPRQKMPDVMTYVTRPYTRANATPSTVTQALSGAYSTNDIVAFLRLDRVDPSEIEWADETRYSKIAIAGAGSLGKLHD